jgi:prolyl-tRNA synthetase
MDSLVDKVKESLNLGGSKVALPSSFERHAVTHSDTSNAATWQEALSTVTSAPEGYLLTKTLVFKPKVAKSQTAVLIMVVALEDTATNAGQIAKTAGEKEARFAAADVVQETLGVTVAQGLSSFCLSHCSISSCCLQRLC